MKMEAQLPSIVVFSRRPFSIVIFLIGPCEAEQGYNNPGFHRRGHKRRGWAALQSCSKSAAGAAQTKRVGAPPTSWPACGRIATSELKRKLTGHRPVQYTAEEN